MEAYTIYFNPSDHPGKYVVRAWLAQPDGGVTPAVECELAETLNEARAHIPAGLMYFPRLPGDDPVIVEVWL